jgi:hypothetical protein
MPEEFQCELLINKLSEEGLYAHIKEEQVWMTTVEPSKDRFESEVHQMLIGVEEQTGAEPYRVTKKNYDKYIDNKTIILHEQSPEHVEQRLSNIDTEELRQGKDGDKSEPNERFPWEPIISVAAVGETGRENIDQIRSLTSAKFLRNPSPEELEEDLDFLFITADLNEKNVKHRVQSLLEETDAISILFAEGLTSRPDRIMEEANMLIPTQLEIMPREFYPMFIADLFEAMLPMTIQDLGKGDIEIFAGENRIGKIFLDTPNEDHDPVDFTSGVDYSTAENMIFFYCSGEKQPAGKVHEKVSEYDFPEELPVLKDQRIHSRYTGRQHTKYFISVEAGDNVTWNREKEERQGYRESL